MTLRQRYFLLISAGYIILGIIIIVRTLMVHLPQAGILGVVLIALGVVRFRDFIRWRSGPDGP